MIREESHLLCDYVKPDLQRYIFADVTLISENSTLYIQLLEADYALEAIVVGIHWHNCKNRLHNLLWQYEKKIAILFSLSELVLCK
jgi:hypothetical protein